MNLVKLQSSECFLLRLGLLYSLMPWEKMTRIENQRKFKKFVRGRPQINRLCADMK